MQWIWPVTQHSKTVGATKLYTFVATARTPSSISEVLFDSPLRTSVKQWADCKLW